MEYRGTNSRFTFRKNERLTGKKSAELLFSKGKTLFEYPYKFFFTVDSQPTVATNKVLITVSKRIFKKAVDRNAVKRRIKEGYRKNKNLFNFVNLNYTLGIVYVAKEILQTSLLELKLVSLINKLISKTTSE